jgi:predicted Kef-type K+ transport protein
MPHHTPLISTIVGGIVLAFIFGALAQRVRISPLVGYLLAGVAVGPSTPGFVADPALAGDLAEIGVILLMFGVGLHFSLEDLLWQARQVDGATHPVSGDCGRFSGADLSIDPKPPDPGPGVFGRSVVRS